ncbi:MAG: hypothetical protein J2P17_00945 [Mycobacterium sp.]|nr:hypothetical protein [Mycobacterium sp.]
MSDSRQTTHVGADAAGTARRAMIAGSAALFVLLAVVTLASVPGSVGGRLLLIGVDGVCLAAFAALGVVVTARWKREESARSQ